MVSSERLARGIQPITNSVADSGRELDLRMSTHLPRAPGSDSPDSPELSADSDSVWQEIVEVFLRPICQKIRSDARIWLLPVIAVCAWCRDERVFVALPLVMGLVFVWLLHRQSRAESGASEE
jgi:hypothetical protein